MSSQKPARILVALLFPALAACPSKTPDTGGTGQLPEPEILADEPPGAPTDIAGGRLTCLGDNAPAAPAGSSLELVGYVRTLADPGATGEPPPAQVEAFSDSGASLGSGFADSSKDGRVAVTVPITDEGFTGYVRVTYEGYLDWRFKTSRAVTDTSLAGWAWLATPDERDSFLSELGVEPSESGGYLAGVIHDCDGFGVENAVIVVDGSYEGIVFMDGFDLAPERTYTGSSGRFVLPAISEGPVTVKAFGRLEDGGPLTLLSSASTEVEAGGISAVGLQPRVSYY